MAATVLATQSPVAAASTASIGGITTGTRPGSAVGRTDPTLPTLQYCITYTTTDQSRDYGFEIRDAGGVRPPFGSAFTRQFDFVPATEWAAGSTLSPKTLCNSVTLEPGRTYTLRAWITSGPFDTRGSWALIPASAPTAASYTHVTAGGNVGTTTTTTTTTSPENPSSGSGGGPSGTGGGSSGTGGGPSGTGGGSQVSCPPSAPVRVVTDCVALDIYCRSNPGWTDPTRGLSCSRVPGEIDCRSNPGWTDPTRGLSCSRVPGESGQGVPACTTTTSAQRSGRSTLRLTTTIALARQSVQVEVMKAKRWYVLGTARITRKGLATFSTDSRVINGRKTYLIRATQGSRVVCTGSLTVPVRLNLRGTARLA